MSRNTARFLTLLAFVLLISSLVLIVQFGLPVIFAWGAPRRPAAPVSALVMPVSTATAAPTSTPAPSTPQAAAASTEDPTDPTQAGQARAILSLLNTARTTAGLRPLTLNGKLTTAAVEHSDDQAKVDKMTHDGSDGSQPSDRATKAGYSWSMVGKNVLQRWDVQAAGAYDQWWNSPPHHENMMNPTFTEIGIAYAKSSSGKYYYTMLLGTPR